MLLCCLLKRKGSALLRRATRRVAIECSLQTNPARDVTRYFRTLYVDEAPGKSRFRELRTTSCLRQGAAELV